MKIRRGRKKIIVNHKMLFDQPIELSAGQIDYLLDAGFAWEEDGKTLSFKDTKTKIEFYILEVVEIDEKDRNYGVYS